MRRPGDPQGTKVPNHDLQSESGLWIDQLNRRLGLRCKAWMDDVGELPGQHARRRGNIDKLWNSYGDSTRVSGIGERNLARKQK